MNRTILEYLKNKYAPLAIVEYGSYAAGTNDEFSDFDCMVIVPEKNRPHDDAVVDGVQLDCFIFTREEVCAGDVEPFLTVYDGRIVLDTEDIAGQLKARVRQYVKEHEILPEDEKQFIISWIRKTMRRAEKQDDEGSYRLVSLLWESLTDYFMLRDMFYFGSKKAAATLKQTDPEGYRLYHRAITERTDQAILAWGEYVIPAGEPEKSTASV